MMNITTKTIPHIFRNKYLRETSTTNVVSGGGSGGASLSGDYLPAVKLENEEGYKVDEPKVEYTGNVIAYGEVIAYAKGTEGGSSSSGDVTIYDGLDSEDPEIALSANQGRVLKDLIDTKSGESEISKLLDVEIGELKDGDTLVYDADSEKWINGTSATLTEEDKTRWNNKLDKEIWDSAFYFDDSGNIRAKVNVIGDKEISAYGAGSSSSGGAVTIVDNLSSTASDCALSANMGRALKELIESSGGGGTGEGGVSSWNDLTDKPETFTPSTHTHGISEITDLQTKLNTLTDHTSDTTKHITASERTNWNNKLDKSVWDSVFTVTDDSLKIKVNVVGEGEISAYGAGDSSGSGAITIVDNLESDLPDAALSARQGKVIKSLISAMSGSEGEIAAVEVIDNLDSTDSTAALSANMGRELKDLIENNSGVSSWDDIENKPSTFTPSSHTHTIANITNLQSTLDGKASSTHTHSGYASSSHTHSISNITNLQSTLDGKASSSHTHSGYASSSHTHNYAGSSSAGGAATSANKVNSTLSFTGYSTKSFNGSSDISVAIPSNTNQLTNGAGYITSSGSISGNAATATKLATSRTIWGQSFNGTANVSGALTGVTSITASGAVSCASLTATGEVTAYSDQRLKSDIKPLQIRGELNPVTYSKDGKECIGFIAQEVQKLYPELVLADESPEHLLSLNYAQLTAVLCAEIKELRNEINQLKHEIYGIRNNGNNNV